MIGIGHTVREAHFDADAIVVRLRHEAGQRREAAVREQLEIAKLTFREVVGRPVAGGLLQDGAVRVGGEQIDELPAMGGNEVVRHDRGCSFFDGYAYVEPVTVACGSGRPGNSGR